MGKSKGKHHKKVNKGVIKGKSNNNGKNMLYAKSDGNKHSGGLVVIRSADQVQLLSQYSSKPSSYSIPYKSNQDVLLVGEGDFSFALSLSSLIGGKRITATSYDSRDVVYGKYEASEANIKAITKSGCTVRHNVDATKLEKQKDWQDKKFNVIVFNFPHLGGAKDEDIQANQELLRSFFSSSSSFLSKGGQIHVSLRDTLFYNKWQIVNLGLESGLLYEKRIIFDSSEYPCYTPQRTHPAFREAASVAKAFTYIFRIKDDKKENLKRETIENNNNNNKHEVVKIEEIKQIDKKKVERNKVENKEAKEMEVENKEIINKEEKKIKKVRTKDFSRELNKKKLLVNLVKSMKGKSV